MRKALNILLLVILSAVAAAPCLAQGENRGASAPGIKPPQKGSPPPTRRNAGGRFSSPKPPASMFESREKQVWAALGKKDYDAFAAFLAEDQLEVTSRRVNTKAQTIEGVRAVAFDDVTLSDFRVVDLNDETVIVIYRVRAKVTVGGQTMPIDEIASTTWVLRGGKWLAVFHQGTSATSEPGGN